MLTLSPAGPPTAHQGLQWHSMWAGRRGTGTPPWRMRRAVLPCCRPCPNVDHWIQLSFSDSLLVDVYHSHCCCLCMIVLECSFSMNYKGGRRKNNTVCLARLGFHSYWQFLEGQKENNEYWLAFSFWEIIKSIKEEMIYRIREIQTSINTETFMIYLSN